MKGVKVVLVIFCAVAITALGIDAADTLQGNDGTLFSQLGNGLEDGCPEGMVAVSNVPGITCVDKFEAVTSEKCPIQEPSQLLHTRQNLDESDCKAASVSGKLPWRFVSRDQAVQMCARSNKRLPTSEEWYALSVGMTNPEATCNIASNRLADTGSHTECSSPVGVHDLVGNVW